MIRTAHIITDLTPAGAQMMLYKLLRQIDKSRFESSVIVLMEKSRIGKIIEELGTPVYELGLADRKTGVAAPWKLLKVINAIKPNLIQGWMYHGNLAASFGRFLRLKTVPVIWNVRHSLYDIGLEKKRTAQIIRFSAAFSKQASKIIYNSAKSANQHENLGYADEKTIVIPNGFDCEQFKPSSLSRKNLRAELGIGDKDFAIGLFSRYHPMKDHANFFRAAGMLAKKYDNVRFVLAGWQVDENNSEFANSIRENELANKVHLLGVRQDMPALNAMLDVACLSSAYGEGFPNAVGEAMACGVPCVVTDIGESGNIVGDTGKVVPARNTQALYSALESFMDMGVDERERLGQEARKRIVERYSLKTVVRQYEDLYERAAAN